MFIKAFSYLLEHPDYKPYTTNLILSRTAFEWGLVKVYNTEKIILSIFTGSSFTWMYMNLILQLWGFPVSSTSLFGKEKNLNLKV